MEDVIIGNSTPKSISIEEDVAFDSPLDVSFNGENTEDSLQIKLTPWCFAMAAVLTN